MMKAMEDKSQIKFREQEELNTANRAKLLKLPYVDSRRLANAPLFPDVLTVPEMYQNKLVPLNDEGNNAALVFGITIGTPQQLLRGLHDRFMSRNVQFVMISNPGFKEFMRRYDPPKEVHYDDVRIATEGDSATMLQVSQTLESVKPDDILNYIIDQAEHLNASDIHLENARQYVRIRFRVDGALHLIAQISHEKYYVLQSSIASRANISSSSKDAQTGHMVQQVTTKEGTSATLNMRIETVPTVYGQDAVIRLFDVDESMLDLDRLQLSPSQRAGVDEIISHPHGMVLVVGPTGSGKSTTLYSIIKELNTPQRKLLTLEDPVEFAIDGISQIPVATRDGDSFAEKLRAVLRLDPDVIMVGEIRDVDTARTAIQASITGHLVLSTFHASDASAAFSRIIDMIGQNPIFGSAIKMVIGQRLVRKLDDATKQPYTPDENTKRFIQDALKDLPPGVDRPDLENITLYSPGQSAENPFGYAGRIVIMEQLIVSEAIQALIRSDAQHLDAANIQKTAQQQGMITMLQDGILKVLRGETTIEEVNRVI